MPALRDAYSLAAIPHEITDYGVDWITCFQAGRTPRANLRDEGSALVEEEARAGNDVRQFKWQGFAGKTSGGASYGTRPDGYLVQLRGSTARDHWRKLVPYSTGVSRLDVQVTARFDEPLAGVIPRLYTQRRKAPNARGRRSSLTLITSTATGDSLYVGRRSSDLYGRIYDKGLEERCAPANTLLRWEVEAKREHARALAFELHQTAATDSDVAEHVAGRFEAWRLPTPDLRIRRVENARAAAQSSNARRMGYMRTVVAGMIGKVLETYDVCDVLDALGLSEHATCKGCESDRRRA